MSWTARFEDWVQRARVCQHVFHVVMVCAVGLGMPAEAAEDCGMEFLAVMLLCDSIRAQRFLRLWDQATPHSPAWLHRCARNFGKNALDKQARQRAHELAWPGGHGDEYAPAWDSADPAPGPEQQVLWEEARACLQTALARLEPTPRTLLMRHHLEGDSIQELALASGRTPHAVEQTLLRARHRVALLLDKEGLSQGELLLHFSHPPPPLSPDPPLEKAEHFKGESHLSTLEVD